MSAKKIINVKTFKVTLLSTNEKLKNGPGYL